MSDSPYLRIPVQAVTLGMYVQELCGSWVDHPFWRARFLLEDPQDLRRLQRSAVREVLIDPRRGRVPEVPVVEESPPAAAAVASAIDGEQTAVPAPVQRRSLEDELQVARQLCIRSKERVIAMFQDARLGRAVESESAQELVGEIAASMQRHPNAVISLARLKTADEYTYLHSVAVCALMIALARQLGLDELLVREAGLAGLLHDIGKMCVPMTVLNKPGRLDESEFASVREHPWRGGEILREGRQVSALVLDVCLHHHEKLDGSGYPHRLAGEQISLFARMGAVCDIYDAITSDRPYKAGWDPAESLQRMAQWCGSHLDEQVFRAFIRCLGIYPIGALVRLQSERLAVVVEQSAELLLPVVKVFYSTRTRAAIPFEVLDLTRLKGRERIVGRESPDKWGFRNLEALWSGMDRRRGSLFQR
ncbi:putative nucleotidyltransferase with HDIG domain [Pseudomonas nitritireducens]|uniref:Putative nucleotidyltransferase with HDIG domain n=1 Tax=Pseudomonas nitroreducens TaxID=46680 RepID=A0A7W7P2E4_PSENT|nr:HD-GYP domain-containing protein [Pseudomonas nitritireducens]MBB4864232.1 putative nucleotidyltransferase with HDIG domain [Pseudomonas nitritireducens]